MSLQPDDFSRSFAQAWGNRDAATLVSMLAEDADMLTLTGAWVEGHKEIKATIEGEMNGAFARSRLVTGRGKLRPLGAGAAVLGHPAAAVAMPGIPSTGPAQSRCSWSSAWTAA